MITRDPWDIFFEAVEQLSDDFLANERVQPPLESRKCPPCCTRSIRTR